MNLPKISVIIPVYEVELYIDRCVESVIDQTYTNLEIILVDDGSTDNCPAICDEWAKQDKRIKVIHKANGGLSEARNFGMDIATGELIGFVDSDDWISSDMYQRLYSNMVENHSDISVCGVEMVWEEKKSNISLTSQGNYALNQHEAMEALIRESILKQPVWGKLYKREILRDIRFPVGRYHEDVFWSYQVIGNANKVSVFDTPCYYYFQHKSSIMGNRYSIKRLDALDAKCERLAFLQLRFPDMVDLAKWDLWFSCIYAMQMAITFAPEAEHEKIEEKIGMVIHNIKPTYCLKESSVKQKIWFLLSKISFEGVCYLRNFLKVGI